jgi:DNA-directed RNA polymerase specialized sigma24 family protein
MPYQRSGALRELAQRTNRSVNSLYKLLGRLREKLRLCVEQELITKGGES